MTPLQSSFEQWARKRRLDLTPMTPLCFHVTYYSPDTQNAWVDWIERDIQRRGEPFALIEGQRVSGTWRTLEQRPTVPALP